MKNIIFDFDGTLGDTVAPSLNSMKTALVESKANYDASKLNADLMVMSTDEIIATLKVSGDVRAIFKRFIQIRMQNTEGTYLYPGIKKLLNDLKNGKQLFIATNNFTPIIDMTLKMLDIDIFNDIRTSDYKGAQMSKNQMVADLVTQYKLPLSETVMIGDGMADIVAGKNAGIKTIAVDWGYDSDKKALKQYADFYVKTATELKSILAR
ncbi:MAG: HAD family hydrolase [Rickettsiales bacterium]|nr:HAD family hydrolase [Rickettsiales bacterium]